MASNQPKNPWIHNFSVTETQTWPNNERNGKFTIYRITSVIFPLAQPEALSCMTIWKRYSDVKELHQKLVKKIRKERLRLKLPALTNDRKQYFHRFKPEVIEERRQFIVQLLEYIGTKPSLYACDLFTKFLREKGYSPDSTPDAVDGVGPNFSLDCGGEKGIRSSDTDEPSSNSLAEDSISSITTISSQTGIGIITKGECPGSVGDNNNTPARPQYSADYLLEADERFLEAMEHKANYRYKKALDTYKDGIEILMQGIPSDTNDKRRRLATEKVAKYLSYSESIYKDFILNPKRSNSYGDTRTTRELPLNQLAKYKVMKVISDNVMSVQEVTTRRYFIMKSIDRLDDWDTRRLDDEYEGTSSRELCNPYMVPLVAYFVTEFVIFLLLQPARGGKLIDYIASYVPETFQEDIASEIELNSPGSSSLPESCEEAAPAFETMTSDLDIEELLLSSQKLLHSVEKTLKATNEQVVVEERQDPGKSNERLEISAENFKQIPEACIRQWAKELIVAVNALHSREIILGDLDIHNLLLGKSGQLLLTYYHYRKISYTSRGLVYDMPITAESDWYNVGIILYELLTGYRFVDAHPGGIWFYFEIQFPENVEISSVAVSLLKGLLAEMPENRLGFNNICAHPFFNEADWSEMQGKPITG